MRMAAATTTTGVLAIPFRRVHLLLSLLLLFSRLRNHEDSTSWCHGFTVTTTTTRSARIRSRVPSSALFADNYSLPTKRGQGRRRGTRSGRSSRGALVINNKVAGSNNTMTSLTTATGPLYVGCVMMPPTDDQQQQQQEEEQESKSLLDQILDSGYLGPRLVLFALAAFYATNFPLGSIMADAFPDPSAVTSARMLLAAIALSPNIRRIDSSLRLPAIFTGCFMSIGYITQSMALVDTNPSTVSFLGSATVLVCPFLEWIVDKKPMSLREAPQTWLAAVLCMAGVAMLELWDPASQSLQWGGATTVGTGDMLALVQAFGFGTQVFLCEKMIRTRPDQTVPVTATLIATTAFISALWSCTNGWVFEPNGMQYTIPQLFLEPSLRQVAMAVMWTGFISTACNFYVEMNALSRVPPAEASVILATEPLFAALFASWLVGEHFGFNDYVGGALVVSACLANALKPSDFNFIFGQNTNNNINDSAEEDDESNNSIIGQKQSDEQHASSSHLF